MGRKDKSPLCDNHHISNTCRVVMSQSLTSRASEWYDALTFLTSSGRLEYEDYGIPEEKIRYKGQNRLYHLSVSDDPCNKSQQLTMPASVESNVMKTSQVAIDVSPLAASAMDMQTQSLQNLRSSERAVGTLRYCRDQLHPIVNFSSISATLRNVAH